MSKELSSRFEGKYAVVTGASRGLGRAFALELSQRGFNTVLLSSNCQILAQCEEIRKKYYVDSQGIVVNLMEKNAIYSAAAEINARYPVFLLINNAGLGGSQPFEQATPERLENILQLNVVATSLLTKLLIDNLLNQDKSFILNVSSMAALAPVGYKMVYPASKAFVRHFSLGLRAEYKGKGLSVSVVCPGAMATSPEIVGRIERQGFFGKLTLVTPERVARKCVRQILKGKKEILVNPWSFILSSLVPNCIQTPLLTHIVRRETQNPSPNT